MRTSDRRSDVCWSDRLLTDYHDAGYADRYLSFFPDVERRVTEKSLEGGDLLVREVALTLARLVSYKDEYEVARLHSDPKFWERLHAQFAGDFKEIGRAHV